MAAHSTEAVPVRILYDSGESLARRGAPRAFTIASHLGLVLVLIVLVFRWQHERLDTVFGCDPAGYLRLTQRLVEDGFLNTAVIDPEIPRIIDAVKSRAPDAKIDHLGFFLTPLAHVADETGRVRCQYPPGFPMALSVLYRQGGEAWVYYAQPAFLLLGLLLNYVILWRFIHPLTALPGTAVIAGSNWYFAESTLLMADHAGMCAVLATLLLALLLLESRSAWSWLWAALCGAAAGGAVLVRYHNALIVLPLLVVAITGARRYGVAWLLSRSLVVLLFASAAGAVPLALFQRSVTGDYFKPTYTRSDLEPQNFSTDPAFLYANLKHYGRVYANRLGWWAVANVLGLFAMATIAPMRAPLAVLIAAVVAFLGAHLSFAMRYERYLLPIVPLMAWPIGLTLALFFDGLGHWSGKTRLAAGLLVALSLGYFAARVEHLDCGIGDPRPRADYVALADAVPENAVVLCDAESGAIPIYANRRTCRLPWQPTGFTDAAVAYWIENATPVYVLADSAEARLHLDELTHRFGRTFERIPGPWTGWTLWRLQ